MSVGIGTRIKMETTSGSRGSILFPKYSNFSHLANSFSETKSDCSHVSEYHSQHSHLKKLVLSNWNQEQDVKHQGEQGIHSQYSHLLKCFSEKIFSLLIMSQILDIYWILDIYSLVAHISLNIVPNVHKCDSGA